MKCLVKLVVQLVDTCKMTLKGIIYIIKRRDGGFILCTPCAGWTIVNICIILACSKKNLCKKKLRESSVKKSKDIRYVKKYKGYDRTTKIKNILFRIWFTELTRYLFERELAWSLLTSSPKHKIYSHYLRS